MPYVNIGDIDLYYVTYGEPRSNLPTLLFLHGGPGLADHSLYTYFWSQFEDTMQVIFVDQRGSGRSGHGEPAKWNLEQNGKDIYLFCSALGIINPIVAGVSWGGYVALSYASQYPNHPTALILCNTEAKVLPEARKEAFLRVGGEKAAQAVEAFDKAFTPETNEAYLKYCMPYYAKNAYTPEELGRCKKNPELWKKFMGSEYTSFDLRPQMPKITTKILYLTSHEDPVHPIAGVRETIKYLRKNICELVIIANTGDPVYRDQPEETARIIRQFFVQLGYKAHSTQTKKKNLSRSSNPRYDANCK